MGIIAMCYGSIISSLLCLIYNTYYTQKLIGYGYITQMKDLLHILIHSLIMGIGVWGIIQAFDSSWLQLIIGILFGAFYYIGGAWLMHFEELNEVISLLRKKKND